MEKRALTPAQKKEVINRLYVAWLSDPDLRLGQLIVNALPENRMFYIEDFELVESLESYNKSNSL